MASYLTISIKQNSQDVAKNTSNVTVKVSIHSEASWNYQSPAGYCTINGTKYSFTHNFDVGDTELFSKTLDIPHNADGTKTLSVYASYSTKVSLGTLTASSSKELTTIPRASATRLSASSVDMGKKVTVYTDRASTNFTHKFYYKIGNGSWNLIADNIGDSYEWEVPLSLASNVPAGTSLVLNVNIDTYSGTTRIGSTHNTLTCYVPSTVVPTISDILVEDSNGYATKYSGYVQGKSIPKVTITAEGNYSSISSYKVEFQGVAVTATSNKVTLATVTKTGSQNITVTVTDARGRTTKKTASIKVLDYSSPSVYVQVARCNSDGTANDEGEYMKVSCSAYIVALNAINSKTVRLQYKAKASSSWTTKKTWESYTVNEDIIIAADTGSSYDVQLIATDDFTTSTYGAEVSTVEAILDFNISGKGMSIGKVSEKDGLEVDWETNFYKPVIHDDDVIINKRLHLFPVGSVMITSNYASPEAYLGGTWECFDKHLAWKFWDSNVDDFWTENYTNTRSSAVYAAVEGHMVTFRFDIVTDVDVADNDVVFGAVDFNKLGFKNTPYSAIYETGVTDGGNANVCFRLDYLTGELKSTDINPKTDDSIIPAGSTLYVLITMPISQAAMHNEFCDKFYWRKTVASVTYNENTGELSIIGYSVFYNEITGELTIEGSGGFDNGELIT